MVSEGFWHSQACSTFGPFPVLFVCQKLFQNLVSHNLVGHPFLKQPPPSLGDDSHAHRLRPRLDRQAKPRLSTRCPRSGGLRACLPRRRQWRGQGAVAGKEMHGYHNVFLSGGGTERTFRPLWWRTYRYVQLDVETADEPLRIDDVRATFTAYPFDEKATFASSNPALEDIWDVGWPTARLCANETYFDTPFWEHSSVRGRHAPAGAYLAPHGRRRPPDAQGHQSTGHFLAWICSGVMVAAVSREMNPGLMAYDAVGFAGAFAVLAAGWTTANPTLYRAGLALQAITPDWARWKVTAATGAATAVLACFGLFVVDEQDRAV